MIGKRLRKNNLTIALNVLYTLHVLYRKFFAAYTSKHNSTCEKKKNASINDSILSKRRMALSCSKKTVCIIKKKNIMRNYFLSLFFSNRKPEVS